MTEYHDLAPDRVEHLKNAETGILDISQLPLQVNVSDIDQYPNGAYALLRKQGLGGSDMSAVLGVNPFTTREQLIEEKCRTSLTLEEQAVGDKAAVRKGRDLEPYIIARCQEILGKRIFKPVDMYSFTDFPFMKINFDGICEKTLLDDDKYQYIPCEIKVVTQYGEKHYNKSKCWYHERTGWKPVPQDYSLENNTIQGTAAQYGIPPYYYTQLQHEMLACNAPFGYLGVMFDYSWELAIYFIWKDTQMQMAMIQESTKVWNEILRKRSPNFDEILKTNIRNAAVQPQIDISATSDASDTSSQPQTEAEKNTKYETPDNIAGRS